MSYSLPICMVLLILWQFILDDSILGHSVRLGSNQIAEVEFNGQWVPICGHYFWDNNVGASLFCQQLGYPSGKIEKRLKLPCDGLQVGRCNEGDNWLQCSHPKCNQLIIGGQCNDSPAICTKGENAAISIHCDGSGTVLTPIITAPLVLTALFGVKK